MNYKELMVDDIVLCNGKPMKLHCGQVCNLIYPGTKWAEKYPCEPMPITEEILKANGFEEREGELTKRRSFNELKYYHVNVFMTSDGVFILDIETANDRGTMSRTHIVPKYVHELQHALRLCGMNELADNFKVEQ